MIRVLSTLDLIREYGVRHTIRRCCCCGKYNLYDIRYPDERGTAYLCTWCDVPIESR